MLRYDVILMLCNLLCSLHLVCLINMNKRVLNILIPIETVKDFCDICFIKSKIEIYLTISTRRLSKCF